ncbi:MAG: AMP-binding protein [Propionibacteriaceae bacterium]|jgi:crotonobetaine/carnitine-CoA ligase|nr:AMP-binding protein [Propionibacteriaceae bacterium]
MVDIVGNMGIAAAWDAAVRFAGDRPFLVFLGPDGHRAEYSYREFNLEINRAANAFRGIGVGQGTMVLLQVGNSPEFLTCLFGLAKIGAVCVPVGLQASPAELLAVYRRLGVTWAVVEESAAAVHARLRETAAILPGGLLSVHPSAEPCQAARSFAGLCASASADFAAAEAVSADTLAELLFTSGTTAEPKGVMVTQANMVFSGYYGVWQTSLRSEDRFFTTMPACHSNFQLAALMPVLMAGACLVLAHRYSASRFWEQARAERATVVQLIAMMVRTLLLGPEAETDRDNLVREALYFMPLSDAEKQRFESRFAVRLLNSYGSTESIGWAVTDPPTGERRWPSVGRAGLGYEVGIFDDSGNELPPGEIGEFWIKGVPGRSLMLGYHNDPEATARTLRPDGWMRTNDQGYRDADGWFYFTDRAANLVKRAGENISTTEIENVLAAHPLIAEAAVIGVPDPLRDQALKAFVLPLPGAQLSAEAVTAHCAESLACYKVPQHIALVSDFPRTESMKIDKKLLS